MKNERKMIGVIISQVDSVYQKKLITGILDEAFRYNLDVSIFATFVKEGTPEDYQQGECNIYNMINLDLLDALIIVPDSLKLNQIFVTMREKLSKRKDIPVLCVDYSIDGYPVLMNDDSQDIKRLVDHLIDVHGYTRINFMTGFKGHVHSENRLQGYKKSLAEHNIPFEQERVFYGDFWDTMGKEFVDAMLSSPLEKPQAIACASDAMALCVCDELIERGYKIPEDFAVVGYDYIGRKGKRTEKVTSMVRDSAKAGVRAVRELYAMMTGIKVDDVINASNNSVLLNGTCGCSRNYTSSEMKNFIGSIYDDDESFYSGYNFMMEAIISKTDLSEFLWSIDWFTYYIKNFDGIYFCLTSDWGNFDDPTETRYRVEGYSDDMTLAYYKRRGKSEVNLSNFFKISQMLPAFYEDRFEPSVFYFMPLHFNDRCFGYTVLEYEGKPVVFNSEFAKWMRNIDCVFETIRRQMKLEFLNAKLEDSYKSVERLAVTDLLTGISNRNAYNTISDKMFIKAVAEKKHFFTLIGDLNDLKYINDNYGHIKGDAAIKITAEAMRRSCRENEECFRIGGDEFVIIGVGDYTDEIVEEHYTKIRQVIDEYHKRSNNPYEISISLGASYTNELDGLNVETVFASVDSKMFAEKQQIKSSPDYATKRR